MLRNFWKNFTRSWKHHSGVQLATLTVLVGVFFVVAISWLVHRNLNAVLTRWGENVEMSVYLEEGIDRGQVSNLEKMIEQTKSFERIRFLSKDKAAHIFKQQMGSYAPDFVDDSEFGNPLPASFELRLAADLAVSEERDIIKELVDKISSWQGVGEVSYGQEWVDNYASVVRSFSISSWILMALLFSGSLLIVGNSIRNSISQRRDEIEILELVGATVSSIRTPYLIEGAFMGGVASVLAILLTYILFVWQKQVLISGAAIWGLNSIIQYLSFWQILLIILMGVGFGILGAYLCVFKICNGWAAAQRVESWSEV